MVNSADFCNDYSFWRAHCHNGSNIDKYTHATQCSSYQTKSIEELGIDCSNSWKPINLPNCPNSANKEDCSEKGDKYFYCHLSKTCIDRDKLCDGIVHCIMGEDETLKNCTESGDDLSEIFPPNANEKCIDQSKPGYDIPILAIRCNGDVECKNSEDESHWYCSKSQVSKNLFHNVKYNMFL